MGIWGLWRKGADLAGRTDAVASWGERLVTWALWAGGSAVVGWAASTFDAIAAQGVGAVVLTAIFGGPIAILLSIAVLWAVVWAWRWVASGFRTGSPASGMSAPGVTIDQPKPPSAPYFKPLWLVPARDNPGGQLELQGVALRNLIAGQAVVEYQEYDSQYNKWGERKHAMLDRNASATVSEFGMYRAPLFRSGSEGAPHWGLDGGPVNQGAIAQGRVSIVPPDGPPESRLFRLTFGPDGALEVVTDDIFAFAGQWADEDRVRGIDSVGKILLEMPP